MLLLVSLVRFGFSLALVFLTPSLHLYTLPRLHVLVSTVCAFFSLHLVQPGAPYSVSAMPVSCLPCTISCSWGLPGCLPRGIIPFRYFPGVSLCLLLGLPGSAPKTAGMVASTVQSHCKEPLIAPCPSICLFSYLLTFTRDKPHIAPLPLHIQFKASPVSPTSS